MLATIPSPESNGVHLGPLFIHAYGLAYLVALVAAIAIISRRWERAGGDRSLVQEVALWAFPAGIVGGRLYFDLTSPDLVPPHWWGPFAVWDGGLGIWGGVAAGTAAGLWVLRWRRADIARFMDAAAPGLLVGQAIGRVGNYFNQELFGGPTGLPWGADRSGPSPAGLRAVRHVPADLSLRADLELWPRRGADLAGPQPPHPPARAVRPVCGGLLVRADLGGAPARRPRASHLRAAANFYVAVVLCLAGLAWFAQIHWGLFSGRGRWRGGALLLAGAALAFSGCGHSGQASAATASAGRKGPVAFLEWSDTPVRHAYSGSRLRSNCARRGRVCASPAWIGRSGAGRGPQGPAKVSNCLLGAGHRSLELARP